MRRKRIRGAVVRLSVHLSVYPSVCYLPKRLDISSYFLQHIVAQSLYFSLR